VSPSTVSRVVNRSAPVSEDHRARVEAAVESLGYVPNRAAQSLVTRRTGAVALVVREPVEFGVSDPYLSGMAVMASRALAGTGHHLVLMVAQNDDDHRSVGDYVRSGHVDGVILVSAHLGDPLPRQLLAAHVPLVVGGRPPDPLPGACWVDADNVGGGRVAAHRLLDGGRRVLAAISGPRDMTAAADRLTGFREVVVEAGADRGLVAHGTFTRTSGERAMRELLERQPDLDGVFAGSDVTAVGAMRALADAGRGVPDDVAVVGFDDVELARFTDPPLTTIRQPSAEQARVMVAALLAQIRGEPTPAPVILPTELVVRGSG
jgi:DNA-binding LacI/PurR family transcriptional regulator